MRSEATGVALYESAARAAAEAVIGRYSTSFGLACRLLGPRVRAHVRAVYALVRIADEVVDGPATDAGLTSAQTLRVLDGLEAETCDAIDRGFSANLIAHAFALTARECAIDGRLVRPFFASMRTDLSTARHDADSHSAYVYGSAEVVGLMCLQVFVNAGRIAAVEPPAHLVEGAQRLGAAFQNVNFLRDLEHDTGALGRDYLGVRVGDGSRAAVLDRIDRDLAAAAAVIPDLPPDCRPAVTAAHDLFAELSLRLRRTDSDERVRVPDAVKALIAARAWMGAPPRARRGIPTPPPAGSSSPTADLRLRA